MMSPRSKPGFSATATHDESSVRSPLRRATRALIVALAACGLASLSIGCGSTKLTHTTRTATEQLLLTNAWDSAISQVDFSPLCGVPVFLDTTQVNNGLDQGWIISSIRQAMLAQGVLLRPKIEQAQWVCEARVGAYGTDSYDWMIGVPQLTIPATLPGVPAGTIPELPLVKNNDQKACAKLALFAYDRSSGQLVWNSGTAIAGSDSKNLYIGSIGPIQSGTIHRNRQINGLDIPSISWRPDKTAARSLANLNSGTAPSSQSASMSVAAPAWPIAVKEWDEDFRP